MEILKRVILGLRKIPRSPGSFQAESLVTLSDRDISEDTSSEEKLIMASLDESGNGVSLRKSSTGDRLLLGPIFLAIALVFVALFFTNQSTVKAENERVVTIFYDGTEKTIVTSAPTIAESLERAGVGLNKYDSVEPALDTQLVASSYSVNVYRARPVTVVDGLTRSVVLTPHTSARKIAEAVGVKVYDEDLLQLSRIDDFLQEGGVGLKLDIKRSTPVKMILFGKKVDARTQAATIGELLTEKGFSLTDGDKVWPNPDTKIEAGITLAIYRTGQLEIKEEPVTFETERILDKDREVGYREVKEKGTPGKRFVIYGFETVDGKKIKKELHSYVMVKPIKQVEVIGVKSEGFAGGFGEALAQLRSCEAGGNYDRNSGNGYYGAYQFSISTWAGNGGYIYPNEAPPSLQDAAATALYERRGWQPWPGCTAKLGLQDIYR